MRKVKGVADALLLNGIPVTSRHLFHRVRLAVLLVVVVPMLSLPVRVTRLLRLDVCNVLVRRNMTRRPPTITNAGIVRIPVVEVRLGPRLTLIPVKQTLEPVLSVPLNAGLNVWYGLY